MEFREALEDVVRRLAMLLSSVSPGFEPASAGAFDFGGADIEAQLGSHRTGLFLGMFDAERAARGLESLGVLPAIRARVRADVRVAVFPAEGILRVYRSDRPEGDDGAVLVELKARVEREVPRALARLGFPETEVLAIDWLLMQDPGRPFTAERRRLPGQSHPGLGVANRLFAGIARAATALGAGAILAIPEHYHVAVKYRRRFAFADPTVEGRFQALRRDLAALSFVDAALAVDARRVRDATTGEVLVWEGREMLLPIAEPARTYFASQSYAEAAARALVGSSFLLEDSSREGRAWDPSEVRG